MAQGVFAPGHLGELTQIVSFDVVDAVLLDCRATQRRVRKLPARVTVYALLAGVLFAECGYLQVWRKLTAALGELGLPTITATALWHARTRLGVAPMRALFTLMAGPISAIRTTGARWAGLLVVAIDGTHLDVPDSPALRARLGKGANQHGSAGYPQIRLVALVECGTRAVIDAVFGPCQRSEIVYARRLTRSLHTGTIVLLDRGFTSNTFLEQVSDTGAAFLGRLSAARKPPTLRRLPDGSFLSRLGPQLVRIIDCEITISTDTGHRIGSYRLATNLLDHHRYPASQLLRLYHERWEIETTYYELKKTILNRGVLRARSMAGIAQEIYALLTVYQAIRIAITDTTIAASHNIDPDRASFSIAFNTARDQLIHAAAVIATDTTNLTGIIGQAVLNHPLPSRRLRVNARTVKRPLSRYAYKDLKLDRRSYKATLTINILTGAAP